MHWVAKVFACHLGKYNSCFFLCLGLENCFVWDDKHGFGYNKDGEVIIVKPDIEVPSQMFSSGTAGSCDYQIETKSFSQTCEYSELLP